MNAPPFDLIVEPGDLFPRLHHPDLLILDLCQPQQYGRGHVPGAIHLPYSRLSCGIKPAPGKLPSHEELTALFSELGLTTDKWVIAYDDEGGGWAGRLLWILEVIGHTRYSYLNGGIHAWMQEKLPLEQTQRRPTPGNVQLHWNEAPLVDQETLLAHLDDPDWVIWDARSKEEFDGTRSFAEKAGHIPGARHFEWTSAMDPTRGLRLKPLADLASQLTELGITGDKTVVTHCQTHHRSGLTWLLGKALGFPNIKAYPGSWSEWGNDPATPVERS